MKAIKLKIRTDEDPVLRKVSNPVKKIGISQQFLIDCMIEAMHKFDGIGLAAPQVGVNERILVVDIGKGEHVFINPEILKSWGKSTQEEGCLSVPGRTVDVKRSEKILLKYLDEKGKEQRKEFQGLMARVILHETDHLNGKLILDYAKSPDQIKTVKSKNKTPAV